MNFEYIIQYYKVPAAFGRDVIVGKRKGSITEDMGNYIGVIFHDDEKRIIFPCHPTSEVQYLDTFTDMFNFVKSRSAQRYEDYLHADSSLTFAEWLGIKKKK